MQLSTGQIRRDMASLLPPTGQEGDRCGGAAGLPARLLLVHRRCLGMQLPANAVQPTLESLPAALDLKLFTCSGLALVPMASLLLPPCSHRPPPIAHAAAPREPTS